MLLSVVAAAVRLAVALAVLAAVVAVVAVDVTAVVAVAFANVLGTLPAGAVVGGARFWPDEETLLLLAPEVLFKVV